MIDSGFIKIHRSLLKWEWYTDSNTKNLFLHLLLTSNWEPKKWKGIIIEKGQRVCSLSTLSKETGISVQSIRTSLNHLKSTGEITDESTHQYRVITVKNYCIYQNQTDGLTNDQQTTNKRPTNDQQQLNKDKKDKNDKNVKKRERIAFVPPTFDDVAAYCKERGSSVDPKRFFDYFDAGGWIDSKGNRVKSWKQKIITWEGRDHGGNGSNTGDSEKAPSRWNVHSELDGL